jgi:putative peptidoglycan lipid II flippase
MAGGQAAGRASVLVMAFVLLSRVLGVVRDMVISHRFGQDLITDVYTAAFRIPDILQYLVAGGALATVFVPVFTQYWTQEKREDAWTVLQTVLTAVSIIAIVFIIGLEIFARPLAQLMNPHLGELRIGEVLPAADVAARQAWAWDEVARLSRILLPAQWCFFVGGLMMGSLNARQKFLVPAIGPVTYNLGQILAGWFFGGTELGISAMTWGALIGAVAGNFLLPAADILRSGGTLIPKLHLNHPGVRKVGALLLPALLGLSLSQLGFKNAYNLTQAPIGIFAQATAIVLLPTLSAMLAKGDMAGFVIELNTGIRRILFFTIPSSVLMAVLAEPIISALYLGAKYGPVQVHDAAVALRWYSIGTFAWSLQSVLARGFYASQDTKTPTIITSAMVAVFIGLCFVIPPLGLGYAGLALALSIAGTINMFVFLWTLRQRHPTLGVRPILAASLRIALASGVSGSIAWLIASRIDVTASRLIAIGSVIGIGVISIVVYYIACVLFRVDLKPVQGMLKLRNRKAPTA